MKKLNGEQVERVIKGLDLNNRKLHTIFLNKMNIVHTYTETCKKLDKLFFNTFASVSDCIESKNSYKYFYEMFKEYLKIEELELLKDSLERIEILLAHYELIKEENTKTKEALKFDIENLF